MDSGKKIARIGLFGGSFNPPTMAHKALSEFVLDALGLNELIWIISPHNPDKDPATLAPFDHRKNMVDKYLKNNVNMKSTDIEQRNNSSWTIDTVRSLRQLYPHEALFFIIGADNWQNFHLWGRDYEEILDHVSLIILERPGYEKAKNAESSRIFADKHVETADRLEPFGTWYILPHPQIDVAATQIREALQQGKEPPHLHSDIHDYIKEHNLYQK